MKSKSVIQFQSLYPRFKLREHQVPENLRWKLVFIAERIYRTNLKPRQLTPRQKEQVQDLVNLDSNTLAVIFNFTVKSFLGEKKSQERQCKIKYPGVFEFWKNCRVNVDKKYFYIVNDKTIREYELKNIDISNCRKSKYSFEIFYKNKILVYVKFGAPIVFKQFLPFLEYSLEVAKEKSDRQNSTVLMNNRQKDLQMEQEEELNKTLPNPIENESKKEVDLLNDKPSGYQIIQQNEGLLICIKEGEPRLYISLLLTAQCPLQKIVNFYIQQKQWNGAVNLEQIKQQGENLFHVYRTYKKESIMQTEKSTYTSMTIFCSKQSANILEESIKDDLQGKNERVHCETKSLTKFYRCLGGTKIIIDTQFNIKGYSNPKYAIMFMTKLYSELKYLENSFKISQLQKNQLKNIINATNEFRQEMKNREYTRLRTEENSPKKESADMLDTNDTLQLKPFRVDEKDKISESSFLKVKPSSPQIKPSLQYIQMIQKFEHQRCYLPYKFNQNILNKYDNYAPFYAFSQIMKKGTQYRISKDNQLIYINEQILSGQKDSLKFIIRQIGANILTGKSVLNVSMPVDIFEPRSLLERSAGAFGSVTEYLLPVADADPLTQMKHVMTFIATVPTLELLMQKPFNPILGQTFIAYIKGIPIYYEQISHHPPISAYYMTCPQFTMHGQLIAFADISINSAVGGSQGATHIIFRNGNHFKCFYPPCQISGLIFGERSFRAYGRGYILQTKSNLFAEMSIEKQKKGLYEQSQKMTPADLIGGIFKVNPQFMKKISSESTLRKFDGLSKKEVQRKVAQINGVWFKEIRVDGQAINKNIKIYPLEYPKITLPSDSNYREDVLYHKMGDLGQSQKMKEYLQVKQRADRKLRQKYAKLSKKK